MRHNHRYHPWIESFTSDSVCSLFSDLILHHKFISLSLSLLHRLVVNYSSSVSSQHTHHSSSVLYVLIVVSIHDLVSSESIDRRRLLRHYDILEVRQFIPILMKLTSFHRRMSHHFILIVCVLTFISSDGDTRWHWETAADRVESQLRWPTPTTSFIFNRWPMLTYISFCFALTTSILSYPLLFNPFYFLIHIIYFC